MSLTFVSVLSEDRKIKCLLPFSKAVGTDKISVTQRSIASIKRVQKQMVLSIRFLTFYGRSFKNMRTQVMDDYWQEGAMSKETVNSL